MSALDIETGKLHFFDQNTTSYDDFYQATFASTCIPGAFPPHIWEIDGQTHYFADGYVIGNVDPERAIQQCMELVDDPSKITLDVLMLGNMKEFKHEDTESIDDNASFANFMRARDIRYNYSNSNSIASAMRAYPEVNWRYILQQDDANTGINEIKFNGDFTWPLQENGRQVAQEALKWPEGLSAAMYRNWIDSA